MSAWAAASMSISYAPFHGSENRPGWIPTAGTGRTSSGLLLNKWQPQHKHPVAENLLTIALFEERNPQLERQLERHPDDRGVEQSDKYEAARA